MDNERAAQGSPNEAAVRRNPTGRTSPPWLDGIPFPSALITSTGAISVASKQLVNLVGASVARSGEPLLGLLSWDSRKEAAALVYGEHLAGTAGPRVTLLGTGRRYVLCTGRPLGDGDAEMRLAVFLDPPELGSGEAPESERILRSDGEALVPASPKVPTPSLHAVAPLPLTDRRSSSGYLIAGVAHEISNPLAFIVPTLNQLRAELSTRTQSSRGLPIETWLSRIDEISEGISRIVGVVDNLRAAREAVPEPEATLVNQVVADTLRLATVSVSPGITVRRDLGIVVPARANPQRLGQVLLNLLLNAAHAIQENKRPGGSIFVRTWSSHEFTWLEVRDDGPGVPRESWERIFEPFFTTRPNGTGLGLAVCRSMIRELGGELSLEPVLTPGACFRIRLPVWQGCSDLSTSVETKAPSSSPESGVRKHRRRVLLVDDDRPVRRALVRMLRPHHDVQDAASLQEALEKCTASPFDVLVTDLVMSHGGGLELISQLKAKQSPLAEHVVVISGMAPDSPPLSYPRLTKPCTEEALLAAIDRVAG